MGHRRRAVALSLALLVSGCSSDADDPPPPKLSTIEAGRLTACSDMPYAPFEFMDGDEAAGIDVDLLRRIGSALGVKVEFRNTEFDAVFADLEAHKCDVVASAVSITQDRKARYLFSAPYFEINQSLMVREGDSRQYSDLRSLVGRKIGVQKGTTGAVYAHEHVPVDDIVEFEDADMLSEALADRRIDGVVQDFPINSYAAKKSKSFKVVKTFTDVGREQYGFVFNRDAEGLRAQVDIQLGRIRQDGSYDEILRDYLGSAVDS